MDAAGSLTQAASCSIFDMAFGRGIILKHTSQSVEESE